MIEGEKVIVVTIDGKKVSPKGVKDNENYWKMIDEIGTVISTDIRLLYGNSSTDPRFLVRFTNPVSEKGLECHNEDDDPSWANCLWMKASDLETFNS